MTTLAERPTDSLRGNRDFTWLWTGTGLSFLASQVSAYAYPLIVLWTTGSASAAGLVAFAAQLPYVVSQLPAGLVVDRLDRRHLMVFCDIGRATVIATIPILWIVGAISPWYLAAAGFVEGTLTVLYRIAERAALPSVVTKAQLPAAIGRNEARERAAGLLGQPTAGVLAALTNWAPFLFTAVAHLVSLGTLLMIKSDMRASRSTKDSHPWRDVCEGFAWMWRRPFVRTAVGLIAVSNLLFQVMMLLILVLVRDGGGSTASAAVVSAVAGAGGVLGAVNGPRFAKRMSLATAVIGANALFTVLVAMVAFVRHPVGLGVVFAATAFVGAVWTVAITAHLYEIVPGEMMGRVASIATLMAYGPIAFGSLLGGFVIEELGATGTVWVCAGVMAVLTALAALSPSVRNTGS
ncbi:MFS transporter [Lentzea sp. NBRC 105346]|uniref:MFS transporter n=1 Tax=Lentzea sp. NBRC 105346 TaxID=3032205 RepID=UPI0024A378E2|nr:MFS transporter [Lentzea sp. NBRC 105346]GLZ29103.1 MFS transporter [Lentzea sp. NBRC 105346]